MGTGAMLRKSAQCKLEDPRTAASHGCAVADRRWGGNPPIRLWLTLHNLGFAGILMQDIVVVDAGHPKAPAACHTAPHQQPVPRFKDIQCHSLTCKDQLLGKLVNSGLR